MMANGLLYFRHYQHRHIFLRAVVNFVRLQHARGIIIRPKSDWSENVEMHSDSETDTLRREAGTTSVRHEGLSASDQHK